MNRFLECCSTTVQEVVDAQRLGASRIELCEDLAVGGVTPGRKLLEEVLRVATIPVNVLVRPRGGDFHFNENEVQEMLNSIALCKELGVNAVVIGALDAEGNVDMPVMKRLIQAARPLPVTFHRAFDVCACPDEAFEQILELGCERLLSSGHESTSFIGRHYLGKLVQRAEGRIVVMPGCGLRPSNIEIIAQDTGASEFHASFTYFK